jgi:uncharacterized protein with HEPN domain
VSNAAFIPDEVDYGGEDERRLYRERGYPKNARPYSAAQTEHRLRDLVSFAERCAKIVARGEDAFHERSEEGELLQAAGERYILGIATVVEKLHSDYKDAFPDVPWRLITGMRNLVAHHYDRVDFVMVWNALTGAVPELVAALGLPAEADGVIELPDGLYDARNPRAAEPFPGR